MPTGVKIEEKTFVDSVNVEDLTDDELLFKIKAAKQDISNLEKMDVESEKVNSMIASLKESVANLVAILDSRD